MVCPGCGSTLRETTEPITEQYRDEELTVSGIRHYVCTVCHSYEVPLSETARLEHALACAYAAKEHLLSASEIRAARSLLSVSQLEFERLLGLPALSVSRWEAGADLQSKAIDRLIRLARDVPEALEYLRHHCSAPRQER